MLKQRVLTVLFLVPPLIVALFLLPSAAVAALFGVFVLAAAWEWATLSGLSGRARTGYVAVIVVAGATIIAAGLRSPYVSLAILAIALAWWLWALYDLRRRPGMLGTRAGRAAAGAFTLLPAWTAVALLHAADPQRPAVLLFLLIAIAAADTGAYAAGHAFGRTKLAPAISPGKTVEGVAGGAAVVVLLAYICGTIVWHLNNAALAAWVLLSAAAGLISVIGDLAESKLKRIAGVKDSGTLLPGHGGVLDRIDAVTAAAPTFAFGWLLFFGARP